MLFFERSFEETHIELDFKVEDDILGVMFQPFPLKDLKQEEIGHC